MGYMGNVATTDRVLWTFTAEAGRRPEIEGYLAALGFDVYVKGGRQFVVLWEEPEGDLGEVVEGLWEVGGGPFEVTHEELGRLSHLVYYSEDEPIGESARAAA
jgi:hypothetical protein